MTQGAVLKWRQIFPREKPLNDGRRGLARRQVRGEKRAGSRKGND